MIDTPYDDPSYIGDCAWCSEPVYEDEDYEAGDDGEGVMHADCGFDTDAQYDYRKENE